jgi:hypothetical protein
MIKFSLLFLISNEFRKYLGSFLHLRLYIKLFANKMSDSSDSLDDDYFLDESSHKKCYSNGGYIKTNSKCKFELKIFNTNKLFRVNV